jgi:hypothetical protein
MQAPIKGLARQTREKPGYTILDLDSAQNYWADSGK